MKRYIAALFASVALHAQAPDTILINGKILTADARFSTQQALAVREGKIAALGTTATIRAMAGPATRVIDLGGRTVIPGLIDAHVHYTRAGINPGHEARGIERAFSISELQEAAIDGLPQPSAPG